MAALHEFYDDSEIFVTGGSGVVGKALIEKLLRSCNVRCIYVLLRTRRQLSVEQRLAKLREATIFERLRAEKPQELDKLVAVPGDVILPRLGISVAHAQRMAQVSLVFHCAATVRFDEPLRMALQLNVGGTLEALKFADTLQQLRMFVHVSTFFSNPYLKRVEPKFYKAPMDWRKCLRMVQEIKDVQMFDALTQKLITGFPNTYTFTKNLAESLINDYYKRLPVIIYRPSIVLFTIRDPVSGFAPTLTGAMGLFALVGAGILKTVYMDKDVHLDVTPQDVGIKSMIWYTRRGYEIYRQGTPDELLVYQSSSNTHVLQTFHQVASQMDNLNLWYEAPFEKNLILPGCVYTRSNLLYHFLVFTKQIVPALLVDTLLVLFGRQPAVMAIVRKVYGTLQVMRPFMFNNYDSPGTTEFQRMVEETRGTAFDQSHENKLWTDKDEIVLASRNMLKSIRQHLLREDPSTIRRSQRVMQAKIVLYKITRAYCIYKLLLWLYRCL